MSWRKNWVAEIKQIDLMKSGKLTYLGELKKINGKYYVKVLCECGTEKYVNKYNYTAGITKSCGCLRHDAQLHRKTIKNKRIYQIHRNMIARCDNPNNHAYKDYGGRGITVSEDWYDYSIFEDWALNNGYDDNLTIDRIDNNSGYNPDNCAWTDFVSQNNNRRGNRVVEYKGEKRTIAEWIEILKLPRSRTYYRIKKGWSVDDAFEK